MRVLALAITSCLTLCRLRRLQAGGRKARDRARRLCHSLPPVLQSALARPGEADLCQALELFGFTLLQARCVQDPFKRLGQGPDGLSFIYQLGSQGLYIGQGALVRGASVLSGGADGVGNISVDSEAFLKGSPSRSAAGTSTWPQGVSSGSSCSSSPSLLLTVYVH